MGNMHWAVLSFILGFLLAPTALQIAVDIFGTPESGKGRIYMMTIVLIVITLLLRMRGSVLRSTAGNISIS